MIRFRGICGKGPKAFNWPKKASKVPTDVTESVVRAEVLKRDLVDVKVAAVNEIWSGLKLVIRKDLR